MEFYSISFREDDTIPTKTTEFNRHFSQHDIFHNHEVEPCPICKSTERDTDSRKAEVTCAKCGCVLEENIVDQGPEWRAYNHEQINNRARAGAPLSYAIGKNLTWGVVPNTTVDEKALPPASPGGNALNRRQGEKK